MDKILEGLITSSYPLNVKRAVVKRVVESAENSVSDEDCKAIFNLTARFILTGSDNFQKQVGYQVLEAYARYHRPEFENFFNKDFVLSLLQQGYGSVDRKDVAIIDYIHNGLKLIMSCPSVLGIFEVLQLEILRVVCERPGPHLTARLSELMSDFVQCVPKGKSGVAFCQQLVRTISHFQCNSTQEKELREYVAQVNKVSSLLQDVWNIESSKLLPSLQEVFAIISSTDPSFEPSIALASLVQHIPLQMISVVIRSLTTDQNVKDVSMTRALCRMIDWLSWPLAQRVDTWVNALLKGLAAVQKFTILIDVTLLKINLVFNRLWFPLVRNGALAVLSHMLLSFQHSPEAFHLIVPHIVSLIQFLRSEDSPASHVFLLQFSELVHCMMYQFSGFPELYESILEAIKDIPKPSERNIKIILNQSAWTSQANSLASCLSRLSGKSETGKTGLINLGNTCYMNSILQALYMATDFRRAVLSLNLNGSLVLMKKLQHLFAFLAHTQRAAYAPHIFFEASRPPWFTPRSQQDCSEYLRYLLDRLHEEEKSFKALTSKMDSDNITTDEPCAPLSETLIGQMELSSEAPCKRSVNGKTLIEKMFGGKLQTRICCLNCASNSYKEEVFTDLSLAFCPCSSNVFVKPTSSSIKDENKCTVHISTKEKRVCTKTHAHLTHSNQVQEADCKTEAVEGILQELPSESSCLHTSEISNHHLVPGSNSVMETSEDRRALSVTDLIDYFLAPEILDGDNRYYCENCASLQIAEKTMEIIEEPEYLILTLLRFSYDPNSHVRHKILDNVSIPQVLQLPIHKLSATLLDVMPDGHSSDHDTSGSDGNHAKKLKHSEEGNCIFQVPYILCSVVVHSGMSSESGHYYSYARNVANSSSLNHLCPSDEAHTSSHSQDMQLSRGTANSVVMQDLSEMTKEWFLFNDSRVTFTSFQSVQNITNRFPKDTAYVLFYKKQDNYSSFSARSANTLWVNGDPPLQKELMDAITSDNKLYLQEQELNARTRALQAASTSCSFRPNGFDDSDPPGSCGPAGGGGGGGFSTISRLVF
ncbi:ubiquitin carboxyl-terminal hydrolase 38 [Protopterus annectens]|uniref:ubiquitin carboxyl-terminal hydrolase 38 n=1 Tax=Protopterus annectens TaxID=7888 RepID=UPI001CFAFC5C|nr:ubiquitin carboxyl-terminal hydrolase 38 [Protopterus annectens]